jgi:hypothetical protein
MASVERCIRLENAATLRFGTATGPDGTAEVLFDISGVVVALPVSEAERLEASLHNAIGRAHARQVTLDRDKS